MSKLDYPQEPCYCGSTNFWYTHGNWVCMKCHPPIKGDKEELIARAMLANWKLYLAWFKYKQLEKTDPAYEATLDQFRDGTKRATELSRQLKERGLTECLYIEDGKKLKKCNVIPNLYEQAPTIENFFCHCCPNEYWFERELFDIEKKKNPELFGNDTDFKRVS